MGPRAAWRLESLGLGLGEVYNYRPGKLDWLAFGLPSEGKQREKPMAGDVVRTDVPTCLLGEKVADARRKMADGWTQCMVLNDEGIVLGRVRRRHLDGNDERRVEEAMEEGPSTYRPSTPVEELINVMKTGSFESVVISDSNGRLWGLLSRQDAEAAQTAAAKKN